MSHTPRHRDDSESDSRRRALLGTALATPLGISLAAIVGAQAAPGVVQEASGLLTSGGSTATLVRPSGLVVPGETVTYDDDPDDVFGDYDDDALDALDLDQLIDLGEDLEEDDEVEDDTEDDGDEGYDGDVVLDGSGSGYTATTATATTGSLHVQTVAATTSLKRKKVLKLRRRILSRAKSWYGVKYRYGGTSRKGVDCSGLTKMVYRSVGLSLPRTSSSQNSHVKRVRSRKQGDLVFFHNSGGSVFHVGIYANNGRMIDAPHTGDKVRRRKIWDSSGVYVTYGRHSKLTL